MAAKFIILFAACFVAAQAGLVRRDAPNVFEEISKNMQELGKVFSEQVNDLLNSSNTAEINKSLKEGTDSILQQASSLSASLQSALTDATGKAKETLEKTQAALQQEVEKIRREHPDVEQHAHQLGDKLKALLQTTSQEAQKLGKELGQNMEETNKKLAPKIKEAYEQFLKHAEDVQKKLHETAAAKQ